MNTKSSTNLLIDDYPILVLPKLATKIGLNEAIVLQQMHYWLRENRRKGNNYRNGRFWTYNSYESWVESFPFWSSRTIRRAITSLENLELLTSDNFNKMKRDRTKWYTINYDKLETLEIEQSTPCGQNGQMQVDNLDKPLPETSSETSFKKNKDLLVSEESYVYFDDIDDTISKLNTQLQTNRHKISKDNYKVIREELSKVYLSDDIIDTYIKEYKQENRSLEHFVKVMHRYLNE